MKIFWKYAKLRIKILYELYIKCAKIYKKIKKITNENN